MIIPTSTGLSVNPSIYIYIFINNQYGGRRPTWRDDTSHRDTEWG